MLVEIRPWILCLDQAFLKATVGDYQLIKIVHKVLVLIIYQTLNIALCMHLVILLSEQYNEEYIIVICI